MLKITRNKFKYAIVDEKENIIETFRLQNTANNFIKKLRLNNNDKLKIKRIPK
jgi:hypothetical protein